MRSVGFGVYFSASWIQRFQAVGFPIPKAMVNKCRASRWREIDELLEVPVALASLLVVLSFSIKKDIQLSKMNYLWFIQKNSQKHHEKALQPQLKLPGCSLRMRLVWNFEDPTTPERWPDRLQLWSGSASPARSCQWTVWWHRQLDWTLFAPSDGWWTSRWAKFGPNVSRRLCFW